MSLSKYYISSNSFQPEELVKRTERRQPSPGWQSLVTKERSPFQKQPLSTVEAATPAQDATGEVVDAPGMTSEASEQKTTAKNLPAGAAVIDLSNYLEMTIAEQKIEEAYRQGVREGQEKSEQDFGAAARILLNTCQQLDTIRETIISNSGEELQNFALAIAERILRISVREQDITIIATIEEALRRAVKSDEFTIYIHPEDYQAVAEHSAEIIAGLTGLNKIVLKKDSRLQRGGAKIESENCTIDATILSQFEMIREELKKNP